MPTPNTNLVAQFSGPIAQGFANAVDSELGLINNYLNYLYNVSIATANTSDLINIGLLIGYPWPSAPDGTFDTNAFLFGDTTSVPSSVGFSDATVPYPRPGGLFTSALVSGTNVIPSSSYAQMLTGIAWIKYNGLSYAGIDKVLSSFSTGYTYSNANAPDILVQFSPGILGGDLWVLNNLFSQVATDPQVIVENL